jgi:hypothetical protein
MAIASAEATGVEPRQPQEPRLRASTRAVLGFLAEQVEPGQIRQVRDQVPDALEVSVDGAGMVPAFGPTGLPIARR